MSSGHPQFFTQSSQVTLWFDDWMSDSTATYLAALTAIGLFCVFHEYMMWLRGRLQAIYYGPEDRFNYLIRKLPRAAFRLLISGVYAVNITSAYLIMLAVMTYNPVLFLVVLLALVFSQVLFYRNPSKAAKQSSQAVVF